MSRRKGGSRKDTRSLTLPGFPQPDGGKPSRWPLVNGELADQLLGQAEAMTGHLGQEKHDPAGHGSGNSRATSKAPASSSNSRRLRTG